MNTAAATRPFGALRANRSARSQRLPGQPQAADPVDALGSFLGAVLGAATGSCAVLLYFSQHPRPFAGPHNMVWAASLVGLSEGGLERGLGPMLADGCGDKLQFESGQRPFSP